MTLVDGHEGENEDESIGSEWQSEKLKSDCDVMSDFEGGGY